MSAQSRKPTAVTPPAADLPPIERLRRVMAALRDPESGCPWDIEQTFETIAPYTIEEAYEVADAIAQGDMPHLEEELGDLLLQVIYYTQMGSEAGHFDFDSVAEGIAEKMIRRHPHVFGTDDVADSEAQTRNWEAQKAEERARKAAETGMRPSSLDGIPASFPALMRAVKLQKRAARVGFDWPAAEQVLDKLDEEIGEVRAEMRPNPSEQDMDRLEDELGDLLFVCVNLARKLGVDPESALRRCNRKFETRFRAVETMMQDEHGKSMEESDLDEMEALWQRAKQSEKS
ncbi:nucleoside triphosphate pyrophosphohydrolase [Nisaea acidiphila]|uniref:Nucleoside triphosphate pyrophosphohydrolase n=1 Tax=Nisaea acidiphila TaxID=1862145 RepID=A0A9J7AS52_9PROT|nr:nucleoside triphosphate pyrophosphohydrolase [Nisaea acidiphila]UUX50176.1 nucleoside triphosphate pyrophosphohydrolase [Nisaea acidiphila]